MRTHYQPLYSKEKRFAPPFAKIEWPGTLFRASGHSVYELCR